MNTELYNDPQYGTVIRFIDRPRGEAEVEVVVHYAFSKLTMHVDLDEVDRLLAVREHAVDPALDIAEHFTFVHHCPDAAARRAAVAFIASAGSLAETIG